MQKKNKFFPIFDNKFDLIATLNDEQLCLVIRSIGLYLKGIEAEIEDLHTRSVYELLINDLMLYDSKCEQVRERAAKRRAKKENSETDGDISAAEMISDADEVTVSDKSENPGDSEKSEYSGEIAQVVEHLNRTAGTHYRAATPKTRKCIRARLREGFTVEDFRMVISKMVRVWTGTEFEKYIRPETLFGTKFESYLNRTDKTDSELCAEADLHRRYDGLMEWAERKEREENDSAGIYQGHDGHIGELSDRSQI